MSIHKLANKVTMQVSTKASYDGAYNVYLNGTPAGQGQVVAQLMKIARSKWELKYCVRVYPSAFGSSVYADHFPTKKAAIAAMLHICTARDLMTLDGKKAIKPLEATRGNAITGETQSAFNILCTKHREYCLALRKTARGNIQTLGKWLLEVLKERDYNLFYSLIDHEALALAATHRLFNTGGF